MKIATVAFAGSHDIDRNVAEHIRLLEEAAGAGADLVVFPEISLQGYPPDFARFYPDRLVAAYDNAEAVPDGEHVATLIDRARTLGIHAVFGLNECGTTAGVIYNCAVLCGPRGYIGKYRKVHVGITEQLTWRKGDDWPVFDTDIGRIGLLICYDKTWPESARELTLRGADLLVMPTAWFTGHSDPADCPMADQYLLFDRARAAENCRWFISSNFAGELGGGNFIGFSQIIDPMGRVVATSGPLVPGMVIADVDIAAGIKEAQSMQGARLIRDRRPDTYSAVQGRIAPAIDG